MDLRKVLRAFVLVVMATSSALSSPFPGPLGVPFNKGLQSTPRSGLMHTLQTLLSRQPEITPPETREPEVRHRERGESSGAHKRGGLGRCIHNCLHSGGGLNFIQCKTMCY
ncbi:conotoxin vil14a-like [Babylonia areolata]|uniref:conotoxin vil14a-like n=1 Tax=Babylonia areolata TaxID=304850 RepID=UPI003FCFD529